MTEIELTPQEFLIAMAMQTIIREVDKFANEEPGGTAALFGDMEATVNAVMPVVIERTKEMVSTWDEGEPPDVIVGFDHRHGIAASAWLDGLFAGVRWQRILMTGSDRRQGK